MNATITLSPQEAQEIIRHHLLAQGFEVVGEIKFSVAAGYDDPLYYKAPALTGVTAQVKTPAA